MKILLSIPDTLNEKLVKYCEAHDYEKSEFVRKLIREALDGTKVPENTKETGTMPVKMVSSSTVEQRPVKAEVEGPSPSLPAEVLWEDYNMMPVYKIGIDEQYCPNWCKKGIKQRIYPIKKFDIDSKLLWEKQLCKDCIEKELSTCKSFGGHLE